MWRKSLHQIKTLPRSSPSIRFKPWTSCSHASVPSLHFSPNTTPLFKPFSLIRWRAGCWNRDRDGEKASERASERENRITPKRIWTRSNGKNHFHISQQTTDSERKEGDRFQQRSRLKQTRHCAFPVWTGAQPRPVTCTTASTVSLPLAPAPYETELGHLSFSFSLPPARTPVENKCFWFFVYFSFQHVEENDYIHLFKCSFKYFV